MIPSENRLTLDAKKIKRRAGTTEYTRMDLVLSPDGTMLRGVASWSNGLNANRANEQQLLQAQSPSSFFPWGIGGSSLCLTRVDPPPAGLAADLAAEERPTVLLEAQDPDSLADAEELKSVLDELDQWLTAMGYEVQREKAVQADEKKGASPDFLAVLEVARFQANITGQEAYLDTLNNQPVKFLKGTISIAAAFTIKDARRRPLLRVELQRTRESATPDDNPTTRATPRGTVLLPPNLPADVGRVLKLLPGQAATLPARQKRSNYASRLEELRHKSE
jgi:hypothetical protein